MLIMTNSAAETERPAPVTAPVAPASVTTTGTTKSATATTTTTSSAVISPSDSPTLSATAPASTSNKPQEPQSVLARRQFPAVVFLVHYSSPDALPSVSGVFMSLSNANQECRRLRSLDSPSSTSETPAQTEARVREERKRDIGRELERWSNAEGVECWVEVHEVVPRKWVDRGSVSSVTNPAGKLYENEEEDDEIVEEEEDEEYAGH